MIPIRDTVRSETYPIVNYALIAVNVLVFLLELAQGPRLQEFLYVHGLVPARYSAPHISAHFTVWEQASALFTFMFLHGGVLHLLGNMWFLYIFGDNVEDRLGHGRYLAFFLLCGIASGLSHLVLNLHSNVPTVGASGAIAGVMGAYFLLHPRARVLTLVPIIIFFYFVEVPAFVFLGVWLLFQFLSAGGQAASAGGVAWWAHIGGFLFGMLFLKAFQALPHGSGAGRLRTLTEKHTSPRVQAVHPRLDPPGPDLQSEIRLTRHEALHGTRKLIGVRQGFRERNLLLTVPPGIADGAVLRLRGLGRVTPEGRRGDLHLRVRVTG